MQKQELQLLDIEPKESEGSNIADLDEEILLEVEYQFQNITGGTSNRWCRIQYYGDSHFHIDYGDFNNCSSIIFNTFNECRQELNKLISNDKAWLNIEAKDQFKNQILKAIHELELKTTRRLRKITQQVQDLDIENSDSHTVNTDNDERHESEGSNIDNLDEELEIFDETVARNIPINNILSRAKDCYIEKKKWHKDVRLATKDDNDDDCFDVIVLIDYKTKIYRTPFVLIAYEYPNGSSEYPEYPNGRRYFRIDFQGNHCAEDNENIFTHARNLINTRVESAIASWQNETGYEAAYVQKIITDNKDLQRNAIAELDKLEAKFKQYGIEPFHTPKPLIVQQKNARNLIARQNFQSNEGTNQNNQVEISFDGFWLKNAAENFPWLQKFIYLLNKFFNKAFPLELSYQDFQRIKRIDITLHYGNVAGP
jgi:hypothetical protein